MDDNTTTAIIVSAACIMIGMACIAIHSAGPLVFSLLLLFLL
jgi:hypothetical protein